jgi:hypothetical protein
MATMTQSPVLVQGTVLPKGLEFSFFADVKMIVSTTTDGFHTSFTASDKTICNYHSKTAPWQSPKIECNVLAQLHNALEGERKLDKTFLKGKLHDLMTTINEKSRIDPETKLALSSPVAQKVIDATDDVIITPGETTIYTVIINGKPASFTSDDLYGPPRKINTVWLDNTFEQLDATKADYREMVSYWLKKAKKPDPDIEPVTDIDMCLERFQMLLPSILVSDNKTTLIDGKSIWMEKIGGVDKTAWVPAAMIEDFLDEQKKDPRQKSIFRGELYRNGITIEKSSSLQRFKPGQTGVRRCWPILPEYVRGGDVTNQQNVEGPV